MIMDNFYVYVVVLQQCNQTYVAGTAATSVHLPKVRITRKQKFWKQMMLKENKQVISFSKHLLLPIIVKRFYVLRLKIP